jgi:hypothetical protein
MVKKHFDNKIIFANWNSNNVNQNARENYENSRIIKIKNNKHTFFKKLLDEKFISKKERTLITKDQIKMVDTHRLKLNQTSNNKMNNVKIKSFQLQILTNTLPIHHSANRECQLCQQKMSNGWHILLFCPKIQDDLKVALMNSGLDNSSASNFLIERRGVSLKSNANKFITTTTWAHNWAIWKTYNDKRFQNNDFELSNNLKYRMCQEEFKLLLRYIHKHNKTDLDIFNDHTIFYKTQTHNNTTSIFYKQNLINIFREF